MNEFGFRDPQYLWLVATLVPIAAVFARSELTRARVLSQLGYGSTNYQGTPSRPRLMRTVIILLACLAACISIARPYLGYEDIPTRVAGRDIFAVLDISLSMRAEDASPSRLAFAKRKLTDLAKLLQRESPQDRLGIVLFAGDAYLYLPPTSDFRVSELFINSISTDLITAQGSNINRAIEVAIHSIESSRALKPILMMLSDGEDQTLQTSPALAQLKAAGLSINTIGFGTLAGSEIPTSNRQLVRDNQGKIVTSKLDPTALTALAQGSGGQYLLATIDDRDLRAILGNRFDLAVPDLAGPQHQLSSAGDQQREATVRAYNEIGPQLILLSLILLALAATLTSRLRLGGRFSVTTNQAALGPTIVALALTAFAFECSASQAYAQGQTASSAPALSTPDSPHRSTLQDGYELFQQGNYQEAADIFSSQLKSSPTNAKIKEALAGSLYKLGDYAGADKLYSELAEASDSGRALFRSLYNQGNARVQAQQFDKAIESYKKALEVKPGDQETEHNLEVAQKLLKIKQQQEQQKQQQNNQKQQDNQDQQDQAQNSSQDQSKQSEESSKQNGAQGNQQPNSDQPDDQKQDSESQERSDQQSNQADSNSSDHPDQNQDQLPSPNQPSDGKQEQPGESESDPARTAQQSGSQQHDPKALKEAEARAWLDSLSEAPILLRRKVSRGMQGEQRW